MMLNGMGSLPLEIIDRIFMRLSAKSLMRCKYVCRAWYDKIENPRFQEIHFSQSTTQNQHVTDIIFFKYHAINLFNTTSYFLDLGNIDDSVHSSTITKKNKKKKKTMLKMMCATAIPTWFDLNLHTHESSSSLRSKPQCPNWEVSASCNGLLCLIDGCGFGYLCICNPITGEYLMLPKDSVLDNARARTNMIGLGFDPATGIFKVIRFCCWSSYELRILTIGKENWRRIGWLAYPVFPMNSDTYDIVSVSGALHWLSVSELGNLLISLEVGNEEFHATILPPLIVCRRNRSLWEWKGCVSLWDEYENTLWVLKDYKVDKSWTKQFTIRETFDFKKLGFLENGEILVWYKKNSKEPHHLVSFDIQRKKFRKLVQVNGIPAHHSHSVIPHSGSLASIKAAVAAAPGNS